MLNRGKLQRLFEESQENAPKIYRSEKSVVDKRKKKPLTEAQRGMANEINSMLDERIFKAPQKQNQDYQNYLPSNNEAEQILLQDEKNKKMVQGQIEKEDYSHIKQGFIKDQIEKTDWIPTPQQKQEKLERFQKTTKAGIWEEQLAKARKKQQELILKAATTQKNTKIQFAIKKTQSISEFSKIRIEQKRRETEAKQVFEKDTISNAEHRFIKYAIDGDMNLENDDLMSTVIPDAAYYRNPNSKPSVLKSIQLKEQEPFFFPKISSATTMKKRKFISQSRRSFVEFQCQDPITSSTKASSNILLSQKAQTPQHGKQSFIFGSIVTETKNIGSVLERFKQSTMVQNLVPQLKLKDAEDIQSVVVEEEQSEQNKQSFISFAKPPKAPKMQTLQQYINQQSNEDEIHSNFPLINMRAKKKKLYFEEKLKAQISTFNRLISYDKLNQNFGPQKAQDLEKKILQDLDKRLKMKGVDVAAEIKKSMDDANDLNEMLNQNNTPFLKEITHAHDHEDGQLSALQIYLKKKLEVQRMKELLVKQVLETELIQKNQVRKLKAFIGEEARFTAVKAEQLEYPINQDIIEFEQKEAEKQAKADLALSILMSNLEVQIEQQKVIDEFKQKEQGPTEEEIAEKKRLEAKDAQEEMMRQYEQQLLRNNAMNTKDELQKKLGNFFGSIQEKNKVKNKMKGGLQGLFGGLGGLMKPKVKEEDQDSHSHSHSHSQHESGSGSDIHLNDDQHSHSDHSFVEYSHSGHTESGSHQHSGDHSGTGHSHSDNFNQHSHSGHTQTHSYYSQSGSVSHSHGHYTIQEQSNSASHSHQESPVAPPNNPLAAFLNNNKKVRFQD